MKISVILSTYNRCDGLRQVMDSLARQEQVDDLAYEIIVVDNNSKDRTKEMISSFAQANPKIRYVFEPKQGLSNARNAGIQNASGEILAFTDDDVEVDSHWLFNIYQFALKNDFDALGGKVLPLYPPQTPAWVKKCRNILNGPIVCHDHGDEIKPYAQTMIPFVGANMIIKRRVIDEIGGFNPELGAGKGVMGEDTEYFRRLQKAGMKIVYNPSISVFHPVDRHRMSLIYVAKWNMASGKCMVLRRDKKDDEGLIFIMGIPRYLFGEIIKFSWIAVRSFSDTCHFVEAWCNLFLRMGMISAYRQRSRFNGHGA